MAIITIVVDMLDEYAEANHSPFASFEDVNQQVEQLNIDEVICGLADVNQAG